MTDSNHQPSLSKEEIDFVIKLYSNGQYQDAIDQIKILSKSFPDNPILFNIQGACYAGLGQLASAVKYYEKAIAIKPDYAKAYFNLGGALHDSGKYDKSINSFEKSIEIDPNYAEAHNNLGNVYRDIGHLDKAVESYTKAHNINPDYLEALYGLGITFQELGELNSAVDYYQKGIDLNSNYPALHNNLGNAYKELGLLEKGIDSYKNALTINPNFIESLNNLGSSYRELGQLDDALEYLKKAIEINPEYIDANYNLAITFKDLKDINAAVDCYKKTIDLKPNYAEAHNNLGNLYTTLNKFSDAIDSFKKAIEIDPNYSEAYNNLGSVYEDLKQLYNAVECFEIAIKLNPDFAEAHNNLGSAFRGLDQLDDALKSFKKSIEVNPRFAVGHYNLGHIYKDLGLLNDALYSYENAKSITDNLEGVLGNIISAKMNSINWNALTDLFDELIRKIKNNESVIDPFTLLSLIDDPAIQLNATKIRIMNYQQRNNSLPELSHYPQHPKIRIGYFSADFREHPVGFLTAELYELHDREHFEIHAFSFGPDTQDSINLRIKAGVDYFYDMRLKSDDEIALFVRSLEIDIAIDLVGHTADSKTEVFAMTAAPIQLSYIGYLGTMGADYYDYLIADPIMIPKENQKHYVEKIVYLPSFQVNDSKDLPPEITLTRQEVGLPEEGFVFCCFNNTYKFTPTIFDSWARILKAVKGSVLIIYANNELSKTNLIKEIVKRGIQAERLILGQSIPKPKYLARYRVADLFLDTHPYNAGTTASDALKMGLPMLTYLGNAYQARMGASIVNALNLPELITNSLEEYEALAVELATNPDKLKRIKDKLQANLTTAPLFDTPLFTKNIESAYTQMYERYHAGLEPDHIYVEK